MSYRYIIKRGAAFKNFLLRHFLGDNPEKAVSIKWIFIRPSLVEKSFKKKSIIYSELYGNYQKITINGFQYLWPKDISFDCLIRAVSEQSSKHPGRYLWRECKINPGDVVFDIGACEGSFSVECASYGADVIAIEPSKKMGNIIKKLFEIRRLKEPLTVNCLMGISDGSALFYDNPKDPTASKIVKSQISQSYSLDVTTLDNLFESLKVDRVDFIKCDAEGADFDILKGGQKVLEKFHPKWSLAAYHNKDDYKNMCGYLKKFGYKIFGKGLIYMNGTYRVQILHAWR